MSSVRLPEGIVAIPLPTPFLVPDINVYLVKSDPPILVDAGPNMDGAFEKLAAGLDRAGYAITDIAAVLVTHDHIDHTGLLGRVLDESGAEAYAHPIAQRQLADYEAHANATTLHYEGFMRALGAHGDALAASVEDWRDDRQYGAGAVVAHGLDDGSSVLGYDVHYVPGHSSADCLFVAQDRSHAFSGDHLLKTINPNPLLRIAGPDGPKARSLVELTASLERTAMRDLGTVLPGHGDAISDHRPLIKRLQDRYERKNRDVLTLLAERPMTPFEVSKRMFPKLEDKHLFLGMSIATGHLELLEVQDRARHAVHDGVLVYSAL